MAVRAFTLQQEVAQYRYVLMPLYWLLTVRAERVGSHDRYSPGQAVDKNVQETTDRQAKGKGKNVEYYLQVYV